MSISIDISEAEIRNAIAVALAESFSGEKKDALIRDVVRAHLQYKENSYDKETILGKRVGGLIRTIALEEVDKVIHSMRPDVECIVSELLGPSFKESVFENLRRALKNVVVKGITIDVNLERES